MLRNVFQDDLLLDFTSYLNESGPPVVSQIFLLDFSEDGCKLVLFLVVKDLLWFLLLFKQKSNCREQPCKDTSQPTQLFQVQTIWVAWAEFLQVIPLMIFIHCWYFSFSLHRSLGDLASEEWRKKGIEHLKQLCLPSLNHPSYSVTEHCHGSALFVPNCIQEDTVDSRSFSELVTETQEGNKKFIFDSIFFSWAFYSSWPHILVKERGWIFFT